MTAIAHFVAITCYVGAAALAATPFARPVGAPVRGVVALLAAGVIAHAAGLLEYANRVGQLPLTGLGPSLSFAGLVLAATLLVVELAARDVSLTLIAAPLAALPTTCANLIGLVPGLEPAGARGTWLFAHIALSFVGIGAFATAAAAGCMYLVERRELKSRRFGAIFRFFPPLATLDRVNHVAAIAGWLGLTLGVVLAVTYSLAYRELSVLKVVWAMGAWLAVSGIALGRVVGGWQARRAAIYSSVSFAAVVVLYVAFRFAESNGGGRFL
ncbi:MAG: cytochrome c biogenesis protein CcsA [Gemmatimonadaceae bacterium]|nr:cytochrome c biogenesis protein CcsA [Gemmatimonadaceae bacterium]NUP56361.1 cytochrome c biogenesis protein CcsA [Gemmatimonadaceae bacterium]NUP72956.1 cytochrome c biogenesis protein CcsA [Gemmatimonadaceae bacterium]NUS32885.1 cytochrome c biogenesis protein CcsA [Gemmatimonadaceae bacterium]NUS47426.1 cytochrome c biogenesis protein CcsA [Gemmatimonadaceae bacterium]